MAILAGGLAGILISEFQRAAKPALAVINFPLYDSFHFYAWISDTVFPAWEMPRP